ncbi:Zn(II)2Cys6 transcription factor [Aspergillus fischeri NRRL 181]|uniref:C6 and C2H2 transcription factor n=1 Tax=Neosartorya fischeri (strain ATCC 1020 / DSM 3700 / CBS 544.65 / FGSC A1164 / JCM 1740 / NRRL 181 / WB 181) TaxID=331117 RepID=A1CV44_NEOFI|nr:uncharacterized protein NFIA_044400 [Aspergillus fischeri NRRL 181]EAW25621.1 predicted protein [Aspergillus fischeri NRRL 181]KAG2001616.1 hypothetical protein GB937_010059 [Aspergillus fischeri]
MPPQPLSCSSPPPFQCDHPGCGAKYRRKEHLNRHVASHSRGDCFSCPDLLRRHIRIYHPDRAPPASRAQKACAACHARKERCYGGFPCSACQKRGIACSPGKGESQEEHIVDNNVQISQQPHPPRWIALDYVDIYFDNFHPKWPFLHQGTFDVTKEPCVLIQSVIMIGLWIEGSKKSRDAATDLHRSLSTAIRTQMDRWRVSNQNQSTSWPMATYQSVLLQCIFALFLAGERAAIDLNLRYRIQDDEYDLLVTLVESCRLGGIFSYPNMLAQHSSAAPLTLVWLSIEEIKRFGLALYKVCRLSTRLEPTGADGSSAKSELLTLADLSFGMPDSDEAWNSISGVGSEARQEVAVQTNLRDSQDPTGWISQSSSVLSNARVAFDWI